MNRYTNLHSVKFKLVAGDKKITVTRELKLNLRSGNGDFRVAGEGWDAHEERRITLSSGRRRKKKSLFTQTGDL